MCSAAINNIVSLPTWFTFLMSEPASLLIFNLSNLQSGVIPDKSIDKYRTPFYDGQQADACDPVKLF